MNTVYLWLLLISTEALEHHKAVSMNLEIHFKFKKFNNIHTKTQVKLYGMCQYIMFCA